MSAIANGLEVGTYKWIPKDEKPSTYDVDDSSPPTAWSSATTVSCDWAPNGCRMIRMSFFIRADASENGDVICRPGGSTVTDNKDLTRGGIYAESRSSDSVQWYFFEMDIEISEDREFEYKSDDSGNRIQIMRQGYYI